MIKIIVVLLGCLHVLLQGAISFDDGMHIHDATTNPLFLTERLMPGARFLYDQYNLDKIGLRERPVIPNIIHHVWFGVPLSDEDKRLRATWQQFHPTYRFILWTDRIENDVDAVYAYSWQDVRDFLYYTDERYIVVDVSSLDFDNRIFFDGAPNYGEKSDILKYEIVYRVGGMYVDFDFECLRPFDELFGRYDFFTGIQPLDTHTEQLGAALFAAKANHPILRYAVETIPHDRHFPQIIVKTGPIHFSQAFIAAAGINGNIDIAFPAIFFYPCGYEQREQPRSVWMYDDSFAVHHWAGSWLKEEAFVGAT